MEITNELLAAYAEGNVSDLERKAVRQYLTEHPDQLETVMMMMDDDYDLELDNEVTMENINPQSCKGVISDISLSAAAFAPQVLSMSAVNMIESPGHADRKTFNQRLGDLLDEL